MLLIDHFSAAKSVSCKLRSHAWLPYQACILPPLPRSIPLSGYNTDSDRDDNDGTRLIIPESKLLLLSRDFIKGDTVKRSVTSFEAAVVTDTRTEVLLEHAISREEVKEWVPLEKLKSAVKFEGSDRVVYNQWIGTIMEVSGEVITWYSVMLLPGMGLD
jgi:hypothetical protein